MIKLAPVAVAIFITSLTAHADEPVPFGEQRSATGIKHSFLLCGPLTGIVDEESRLGWESKGASRDGYVLPDGNILISQNNRARELTREGNEVWTYVLSPENKELGTVVRLENGNTLVV